MVFGLKRMITLFDTESVRRISDQVMPVDVGALPTSTPFAWWMFDVLRSCVVVIQLSAGTLFVGMLPDCHVAARVLNRRTDRPSDRS